MALFNCPECGKEISDNAEMCPHCGYPIKSNKKLSPNKNPNKIAISHEQTKKYLSELSH